MMLNSDKEDEKEWEKLGELDNKTTDRELEDIQREVCSIVSANQLNRDAFKLVNTYGSVFNMFARKLGFKMNDFDEEGLKSSFGLKSRGGFNNGGGFKKSYDDNNGGGFKKSYDNNNGGGFKKN